MNRQIYGVLCSLLLFFIVSKVFQRRAYAALRKIDRKDETGVPRKCKCQSNTASHSRCAARYGHETNQRPARKRLAAAEMNFGII